MTISETIDYYNQNFGYIYKEINKEVIIFNNDLDQEIEQDELGELEEMEGQIVDEYEIPTLNPEILTIDKNLFFDEHKMLRVMENIIYSCQTIKTISSESTVGGNFAIYTITLPRIKELSLVITDPFDTYAFTSVLAESSLNTLDLCFPFVEMFSNDISSFVHEIRNIRDITLRFKGDQTFEIRH